MGKRTRVAVLGSGCGAMSAAFYLTATEELRLKYEVTVYQQGFRIGGKCASGRNEAKGQRIEEHGLHMFLGFYDEAFAIMRAVYDEWVPPPQSAIQKFEDAFKPQYQLTMTERLDGGTYFPWTVNFPPRPGEPGKSSKPTNKDLLVLIVERLEHLALEMTEHLKRAPSGQAALSLFQFGRHPALSALQEFAHQLDEAAESGWDKALEHLASLGEWVLDLVAHAGNQEDPTFRHLLLLLRLGIAGLTGFLIDVLPYGEAGFDRINDKDFKDWLESHGAAPDVAWSAPVQSFYDMAFAYVEGKRTRATAQAAAGAVLKTMLLMVLAYKEAPLFKMQAGTGDVVFTPLYQVLAARGVKFEFFHRVTSLVPTIDKKSVEAIEMCRQAEIRYGLPYQPLVYVKGFPCWPSQPRWDQLVSGAADRDAGVNYESYWCDKSVGTRTLCRGRDFDEVVLGISVAALRDICAPLLSESTEGLRRMLSQANTVQTCAAQLWFNDDLQQLGWKAGETVLTAYESPDASWADMSQLLAHEGWPADSGPGSVQYLCGVFPDAEVIPAPPDPEFPKREWKRVALATTQWLGRWAGLLWPRGCDATGALNGQCLYRPEGGDGQARLEYQYFRINIDPSERYVLTLPGTVDARLSPGDSGLSNLVLAGDWTKTRLNAGCAEAAFESGHVAAEVLLART